MTITIDGGAGITFPDTVQQTNAVTNTGGNPRYYAARAWVTFDGSATPPTILSAANVASVSRTGTGLFTITFTANMPNSNYSIAGVALHPSRGVMVGLTTSPTVSSFSILVLSVQRNVDSSRTDDYNSPRISVVVFA
jgi:hypothetical protein